MDLLQKYWVLVEVVLGVWVGVFFQSSKGSWEIALYAGHSWCWTTIQERHLLLNVDSEEVLCLVTGE